jgi:uncharacterized protein
VLALGLGLGLAPGLAQAASIDCNKVSIATERAICADRPLVRLDADVNREFARLLEDFSVAAGTPGSPAVTALRDSQRNWLRDRDACAADAACLGREYRRRLGVFARRPDAAASSSDPYVGVFGDPNAAPAVTVSIMRGAGDDVLALIDAAGADAACQVVGIGRLDAQKRLTITVEPAPGPNAALQVVATPDGITVPSSEAASTACGRVDLAGDYPRQGPGKAGPAVPDGGVRLELQTDFGPVTLVLDLAARTVSGFYPNYRGQIAGTLSEDGRTITGDWFQPAGDGPCQQQRHNTAHWGKLSFTYPDKPKPGDAMAGVWSYCDVKPARPWNGRFDAMP